MLQGEKEGAGGRMSIKRYAPSADGSMVEDEDGPFVTFDTMWAEAFGFCSVLSDIRTALGVGSKPMLGELATLVEDAARHRAMAIPALQNAIGMLTLYTSPTDDVAQSGIRYLKDVLLQINGGQG